MTIRNVLVVPTIQWDDGVVFIFSWEENGLFFGGFVNLQISLVDPIGIATQIGNITAQARTQVQVVGDPLSWTNSVKYSAREKKPINIVFDDEQSTVYTAQNGQPFTIQTLFSIHG
jgi:hypothetical protein